MEITNAIILVIFGNIIIFFFGKIAQDSEMTFRFFVGLSICVWEETAAVLSYERILSRSSLSKAIEFCYKWPQFQFWQR